jgi:uncharacterized SAM-binding protein YcdF (DUF218 family)
MHEFASTIFSYILSPFSWIVLLVIAAFISRKSSASKGLLITALLMFLVFSNPFLLNRYARSFQPKPVNLDYSVYSCGIVAGGFASPDVDGNGYFNLSGDRFIEALKLYKLGKIQHILISGGNGQKELKTFREAAWVKQQFLIMGVPDSVIIIEDWSKNTIENAQNSKSLLEQHHLLPPYLLISSAHHLPRAIEIFQHAGVPVKPYPCNYLAGRDIVTFSSFVPSFMVLLTWNIFLKETAGYLWYKNKN